MLCVLTYCSSDLYATFCTIRILNLDGIGDTRRQLGDWIQIVTSRLQDIDDNFSPSAYAFSPNYLQL